MKPTRSDSSMDRLPGLDMRIGINPHDDIRGVLCRHGRRSRQVSITAGKMAVKVGVAAEFFRKGHGKGNYPMTISG